MNERALDFDLIMALAAGEIPPEKAAEMEAELDAASRRELASQRAALQALGGLEQPDLSAWERRRLRAGVRAELGIAEAPRAGRRYRRRKVRWTRALPALAAAAALVAAVGAARNGGLQRLLESAGDAPATTAAAPAAPPTSVTAAPAPTLTRPAATAAAAAPATTTTAALTAEMAAMEAEAAAAAFAETEAATAEASEAMQDEAARAEADDAQAAEESAEQMEQEDGDAAAGAGGAGVPESAPSALPVSFDFSSEELFELADDAELLAGFLDESAGGAAPFPASELGARAGRAGLACWEGVEAAEEGRVLFMGAGLIDGSEGEAYFIEEEGAAEAHLFNAPDCTNLNP